MSAKLQAVNGCLRAIGEAPVSSLASGLVDATQAEETLDATSKEVQAKGWACNTDFEITLSQTSNGEILLADTVLRVDTSGYSRGLTLVSRVDPNDGLRKLYNVKKQTFAIGQDVTADVVHHFAFEDLTYELQQYIAAKAARVFQETTMGSAALDKFVLRREQEAWAALMDSEAEAEDSNVLTDNDHCLYILSRPYPWR